MALQERTFRAATRAMLRPAQAARWRAEETQRVLAVKAGLWATEVRRAARALRMKPALPVKQVRLGRAPVAVFRATGVPATVVLSVAFLVAAVPAAAFPAVPATVVPATVVPATVVPATVVLATVVLTTETATVDPSAEHAFFERSVRPSDDPLTVDVQGKREVVDFESREARRTYFIRVVASIIGALSAASLFAFIRPAAPLSEPAPVAAALTSAPIPSAARARTLSEALDVPETRAPIGAAPPLVAGAVRSARRSPFTSRLSKPSPVRQVSPSSVQESAPIFDVSSSPPTARFPD